MIPHVSIVLQVGSTFDDSDLRFDDLGLGGSQGINVVNVAGRARRFFEKKKPPYFAKKCSALEVYIKPGLLFSVSLRQTRSYIRCT